MENSYNNNSWAKGGANYPKHVEQSDEFWAENSKYILGHRKNPATFDKNPATEELISDEEIEAIRKLIGKVSTRNIYEQLKTFLESLTKLDFPELPDDIRLQADWDQLFRTWFFELNNDFSNAYWQGFEKIVFNTNSKYSEDIINSISFSDKTNKRCVKYKFFEIDDDKRKNPFSAGFSFFGKDSGKENYYSWVEWFIGSYDCLIYWSKNKEGGYNIESKINNTTTWYSGTRLPKSWQNKIKSDLGVEIPNIIDSAPRGQTIKRKLPTKVVSTIEYLGLVIPSFGGNWQQEFNLKTTWQ